MSKTFEVESDEFLEFERKINEKTEAHKNKAFLEYCEQRQAHKKKRSSLILWLWMLLLESPTCREFYEKSRWKNEHLLEIDPFVLNQLRLACADEHYGEDAAKSADMFFDSVGNPATSVAEAAHFEVLYKRDFFENDVMFLHINPEETYCVGDPIDRDRVDEEYWDSVKRQTSVVPKS